MTLYYGFISWDYIMELYFGIILRTHVMELRHGMILLRHGMILRNYIMELYYGIIFTERTPGIHGVPGASWDSGDPQDALGSHGDAPGNPQDPPQGPPWTTKRALSPEIYSARSSRFVHANHFDTTHNPKDSPGPFHRGY